MFPLLSLHDANLQPTALPVLVILVTHIARVAAEFYNKAVHLQSAQTLFLINMSRLQHHFELLQSSVQSSDDSLSEDSDIDGNDPLSDASAEEIELSAESDVELEDSETFVSKDGAHVYTTRLGDVVARKSCMRLEDLPHMSIRNRRLRVCRTFSQTSC